MLDAVLLYVLYAIAAAIFAYRLLSLTKTKELLMFSGFILLGLLLFWYERANIALLIAGVIIFNALLSSYGRKVCYLFIAIAIAYSSIAYFHGAQMLMQAVFLGILSGSYIAKEKSGAMHMKHVLLRNAIQVAAGVVFIAVLYMYGTGLLTVVLLAFLLMASLVANYALAYRPKPLSNLLYSIEKEGVGLGSGARWLAVGAIVAAAFLPKAYIIVVFIAIFISDSLSTVVGMRLHGPKLPYNNKKTFAGTLAYFISAAAISYLFIGIYALPLGLFAALLESQPFHIDDNFDVSFVLVLLILALSYAGIVI